MHYGGKLGLTRYYMRGIFKRLRDVRLLNHTVCRKSPFPPSSRFDSEALKKLNFTVNIWGRVTFVYIGNLTFTKFVSGLSVIIIRKQLCTPLLTV